MIDLFTTRMLLEPLKEMRDPKTFFIDTFFSQIKLHSTKTVDIDVRRAKRRVAPYVDPQGEGTYAEKTGFKTKTVLPPYVKPKTSITPDELLDRSMGEVVMTSSDRNTRSILAARITEELAELDDQITRAEEVQAVQALFEDKVEMLDIDGNKLRDDIEFGRDAAHDITLAGAALWDATTTADPLKDVRDANKLNIQDSGMASDIVIMGADAADAFLKNDEVRALLDNRRIEMGSIVQRAQELGVTFVGEIEGRKYFRYDEFFLNSAGTEVELVPAKKVLIGSTRARNVRLYGAIHHLQAGVAAMDRFPWSWEQEDPSVRMLQLHSKPLCAAFQPDAFTVLEVIL